MDRKKLDEVLVEQWLDRVRRIEEEPMPNRPGIFKLLNGFLFTGLPYEHEKIVKGWIWMTIRWAIPAVFVGWALGGMAWEDEKTGRTHGWQGFAFADEVDDKISIAIDPIKKDVAAIRDEQAKVILKLDALLRNQTREKIRTLVKQRCELPTDTRYYIRQSINDDIGEAVAQYEALTGRTYEPKCEEI